MFRRIWSILLLSAAFTAVLNAAAAPADACPMCKQANESEEENKVPQAYMYSILFMLAMPATLLTAFGIGFYRLSKRGLAAQVTGPHHLTPQHPGNDDGSA